VIAALDERKPAQAQYEARIWLLRLNADELSSEELAAWESWINESPANRAAYDSVTEAWGLASQAIIARPSPSELRRDQYDASVSVHRWKQRRVRPKLVWLAACSAVLLFASVQIWNVWSANLEFMSETFGTGLGQHKEVVLNDGSEVHLAAMTELGIQFNRGRRDVALVKGQALFEVARNASRPFVVNTPLAEVRAIGTAFDVHVLPDQVVVSVTEGVVEVGVSGRPSSLYRLQLGQRLTADQNGVRIARLDGGAGIPPWLEGRLEYRNQPLRTVLEDVNRYASVPIALEGEGLGVLNFTGTIQMSAIEDWTSALPLVFPLTVKRSDSHIVLREK
jgi:transmembrane sensor